jgi:hypothetical protein
MSEELDKLDRLCAEGIMGWQLIQGCYLFEGQAFEDAENGHPIAADVKSWQPTRNIAQAWEVLERFTEYSVCVLKGDSYWRCQIILEEPGNIKEFHQEEANTAPLAIVRACLKAKGLL